MQFKSRISLLPDVIKNLIIINAILFLATMLWPSIFGMDLVNILSLHYWESEYFQPYQIITHMFMHGGIGHIFFNMFGLWMFGAQLERLWGPKRFLFFYISCGLFAAALHLGIKHYEMLNWINTNPMMYQYNLDIPMLGASGAIFGVLAGFAILFPNTRIYIYFLFPVKAIYLVLGLVAYDLFNGITSLNTGGGGVAHFAHIGGAVLGAIIVKFWNKTRKDFY